MKTQIKNSHKVIAAMALVVALLLINAFKAVENTAQIPNLPSLQTSADGHFIDILVKSDKIEALKKFISGWKEAGE